MAKHESTGVEGTADGRGRGAMGTSDPASGFGGLAWAGFLCLLGTAGLMFGGRLIPPQADVLQRVQSHGLTPGLLLACAGVMFASHLASRWVGRHLAALGDRAEQDFALEQIAADLAQTRSSLQELRVEFVYLKESVSVLGRDLPVQIGEASENSTRDAMYRLAASLDQLGARLEQRIRSQQGALEEGLQDLRLTIQSDLESRAPGQVASHPGGPSWDAAPASPVGLGVLDTLDDLPAATTSWEALPPALPAVDPTYDEKLQQLEYLLGDPRIRAACEDRTRSAGR